MNNKANTFIICVQICLTAALFAVGVFVMQPGKAAAATFQARPDGDVTTNWGVTGSSCGGGHWCAIDENVTTSGTGDFTDNVNTGGNNDLDRWTMTSPTKVDTATDLTAHVYYDATSNRNLSNNMQPQINLYINGSQVGSTYSCANATGSGSWCTATTISGTWSQADIDTLEMEINSNKSGGGPADTLRVGAAYVDVTYSKTQSFEQSSYRLFENQDSTAVGSALATENSSTTLAAPGNNFRLRQLLHVNSSQLGTSGQNFKLQFAQKGGGTCSSPGGSYTDVTSNTAIAYLDNQTPADGDALTATSADPTHGGDPVNDQTYEESNNFTNSQSAIGPGEDGLWDFSLTDNGATQGNTYCLRTTLSDGTQLSTYNNYPQVTIPQRDFNHSAFRFFANQDSTEVGSALASQDNNITLSSDGESFRLRSLFHVSGVDLSTSSKDFQLQFAQKGAGTCSSPDGSYSNITGSTDIRYNDNPTPADGDALTATTADPTHNSDTTNDQSYVEANTFTNNQSAIAAGEDGLWDFSLKAASGAPQGNTYCIRPTESDGTVFNSYDVYPEVSTPQTSLNHSAYRFFANQDSTAVGSALASQDTKISRSPGDNFRLRSLFHVSGLELGTSSQDFQLQYAEKGAGTCSSPDGSYAEVSTTTTIAYNDNPTPADGDALTATSADPTHNSDTANDQSYVEANNFTNNQSAVPAGEDGLWDFSLILDSGAQKGKSYCIRPTKSDGSLFNNYDVYPQIDVPTTSLNYSAFRFFENQDSTDVGSALASQDTDITRSAGENFRLRSLFHVADSGLSTSSQDFQLQFADKTGYSSCSAIAESDWSEVTQSGSSVGTLGSDWTEATSSADWTARALGEAVTFDGKMWILGGNDGSFDNNVWSSTDGENWTLETSSPGWTARAAFDAVVYDGRIWVIGGRDANNQFLNDVWYSSDGVNWTEQTASAPWSSRWRFGTASYDNKLWLTGGYDGTITQDDVWYYASSSGSWTEASSSNAWNGRSLHETLAYDNKIWVIGGKVGSGTIQDDVWYSTDGASWTQATGIASWPERFTFASYAIDGKMWVAGGEDGNSNRLDDVWYTTDGTNWTEATSSAAWPRRKHMMATVYDNKMWIFGGKDKDLNSLNDVWYSSVDTSTDAGINYSDNPTPADGDALAATTADPTHNSDATNDQTYVEANTFTNSQSAIAAGEDGLWDFSLQVASSTPDSKPYCIRPTKADGTLFDSYDVYPEISTPSTKLNHSAFRFFENQDSTDVGSALASQDTDITLSSAGQDFRLRSLFHVSGGKDLATSSEDFQLEYADKTGYNSCSGIAESDWSEITETTGSGGTVGADWIEATSSADWAKRQDHTSITYDGKFWVLGGYDGSNFLNDVWNSTDGSSWAQATSSANWLQRANHTSAVYDDRIWVLGGATSSGTTGYVNDVWSSTDGMSWTESTNSAAWTARIDHSTVTYDGKLWVMGGETADGTTVNDVWSYSTSSGSWTEVTSSAGWEARYQHKSVVYDGKMWVIGGATSSASQTVVNDAWYSTDGINWTEATSSAAWKARRDHSSVAFDNKMWVMGGRYYDPDLFGYIEISDVWHYSSSTDSWTEATSSAAWADRAGHGSSVYDNRMWVLGGLSASGELNDAWYSQRGSTIAYNDNATPADGDPLTDNSGDPTHSGDGVNNQTYEEANTFTNSQSAIASGEDGLWDLSLTVDSEAPTSTPYCIRPTKSDGSTFDSYDVYPQVTTHDGSTGGTVSCNTSATSTDFGSITSDSVYTASPDATTTVGCTSSSGCDLFVKDDGDGSGNPGLYNSTDSYLIDSQTETLSAGSEGYGIQAATTTAGSDGTLSLNATYDKTGDAVGGLNTSDTILASSTGSVTDREVVTTHKAVISNLTTSGSYADTITYSCVAN